MAFDSRVYRILIASPSDVEEERDIAVRVIQEWNDLYSYTRKVVLLPLRWETHTAPEYSARPQEIINKAIVDQCDLLVGIFWTRIGSPTGKAESGTLEEIERVGKAEKPIMLYFSKVAIDPENIDLEQIEKLQNFKKKTYPECLVENYKSIIEFRDKFSKQLELKVRDLLINDNTEKKPLTLSFLSNNGGLIGDLQKVSVKKIRIINFKNFEEKSFDYFKMLVEDIEFQSTNVPFALAIDNSSSSGIRNLYIEIDFISSANATLSDRNKNQIEFPLNKPDHNFITFPINRYFNKVMSAPNLAKFESDKLNKTDKGWRVTLDWEAIQPQRTRLVGNLLYLSCPEPTELSINLKIYADSFPEPLFLNAKLVVDVEQEDLELDYNDFFQTSHIPIRLS